MSLLMLMAILMLGTSAAQIALQEEKASRNSRDRQIALQSAEAALDDAELDIERSSRSHIFASDRSDGFAEGCDSAQVDLYLGLCRQAAQGSPPAWLTVDLLSADRILSVPYGHFTGRQLPTGAGALPAKPPRYIIELMAHEMPEAAALRSGPVHFYRITAIGFGMRERTRVVLQRFYRKDRGGARAGVPEGRFGWREIANWEELRNGQTRQ